MNIIITQVGHPNFRGGGNTVAHEFSSELQKRGHKVTAIFVSPRHLHHQKPEANYRIFLLKQSKAPFVNCLRIARFLRKIFAHEGQTDVVLSLGYEGFFVPKLKRKALFIAASHSYIQPIFLREFLKIHWFFPKNWGKLLYAFQRFLDKQTKRRADYVQALCNFGVRQLIEIYRIPAEKIFVVPNGVRSQMLNVKSQISGGNIIFVGGSSYHKGLDILIRALPDVLEKHPELKILVLGEMKREEKELRSLAEKLNVMSNLIWCGRIPRDKMPEFYGKATLSVFPSRLDTFPMGVLESMAYGIPVIATRVGGIPEIIEDGRTGILVEPENVAALARALDELLSDPSRGVSMGALGQEVVKHKFSWGKVAEVFEKEIYARWENSGASQKAVIR